MTAVRQWFEHYTWGLTYRVNTIGCVSACRGEESAHADVFGGARATDDAFSPLASNPTIEPDRVPH